MEATYQLMNRFNLIIFVQSQKSNNSSQNCLIGNPLFKAAMLSVIVGWIIHGYPSDYCCLQALIIKKKKRKKKRERTHRKFPIRQGKSVRMLYYNVIKMFIISLCSPVKTYSICISISV